jgi:hypothetical protein
LTRARDALAAERRRMPWLAVEKKYEFDGPQGKASLLDLFEGRRQLQEIGNLGRMLSADVQQEDVKRQEISITAAPQFPQHPCLLTA